MTLVVGRIEGPRVAIVSDTLLTEHDKPLPFQDGTVKSCMLPGDICVSFANSPVTAERAFREFATAYPQGTGFANVVSFFEKSGNITGNDYLIVFSRPARLVRIIDGRRIGGLAKTVWIGDQGAYERFREYETRCVSKPDEGRAINAALFLDELKDSPASNLYSAMRGVVADHSVTSAGGFVSVISNRDNGFRFSVYSDMLYDWPRGQPESYRLELKDPINFESTDENQGYAVAQISPGFMGLNLVGFYFVKARKLFFFYGRDNGLPNQCQVFQGVPAGEIHTVLNQFAGVDFRWLLTITSPRDGGPHVKASPTIKEPGSQFAFFVDANTFPKPSK